MDPITPGIVSGLVVNAVTALTKRLKSKNTVSAELTRILERDLSGGSPKFRLSLAAELSSIDLDVVSEHGFFEFLKKPEAVAFAREVATSVLLDEYEENKDALIEQASALLILLSKVSTKAAREISILYCKSLAEAYDYCLNSLSSSLDDRELRRLAREERNSGYLKSLSLRTAEIRRQTPESVAEILGFADRYLNMAHESSTQVMPAHLSDQRGVALESLYVNPNLISRNDPKGHVEFSLDDFISHIYRHVVLGDPGAGKSTLGQKVIYELTASGERNSYVVPFLVKLRDYQSYKKERRDSIAQYISACMREDYQLNPPAGAIEYLLAAGRALVIFDGLDELLDTYEKRDVRNAIENFSELYALSRVLVTSRKVGYIEAPLRERVFNTHYLTKFTYGQMAEYTYKWFDLDFSISKSERHALATSFLSESGSIEDLRTNPLMLSLLCNLYRGARSIPRDRADLYERCATMLFDRWDSQRGIIVRGPLRSDARGALHDIALWVFQNPDLVDNLTHSRLMNRLAEFYHSSKYEDEWKAREAAEELLELWRGRAWILTDSGTTPSGEPIYAFTHQTFLEYFAAIEITRRHPSPEALWEFLSPHIARSEWDIVAQIAIQNLDKSHYAGINDVISKLVNQSSVAPIHEAANLLGFASRYLDALAPSPRTVRSVTDACVDLALLGQPAFPAMPKLEEYSNCEVYRSKKKELGKDGTMIPEVVLQRDDLMTPLFQALNSPDVFGEYAQDEFREHLIELMNSAHPEKRGKALILGLNYDQVLYAARGHGIEGTESAPLISAKTMQEVCRCAGAGNFWIPLETARRKHISAGAAVRYCGGDILFCSFGSFEYNMTVNKNERVLAVDILRDIINSSSASELNSEVMDSLPEIANAFRRRLNAGGRLVDSAWMKESGLEELVVQAVFDIDNPAYGSDYLDGESVIHPLDREDLGASNLAKAENFVPDSTPSLGEDYLFAAGCLMAVFVERERWEIFDYSDGQVAALQLGIMQPMAPVFQYRLSRRNDSEAHDIASLLPMDENDRNLFESWARRRRHLCD